MWISTVLDLVVAALLVTAIVFCVRLERRLTALRTGRDGLKEVILGLNDATLRAQSSIADLRAAAGDAGQALADRTREARTLADELGLMVESANNLATRLERAAEGAAPALKAKAAQMAALIPEPAAPPVKPAPVSGRIDPTLSEELRGAGDELIRALRRAR